MTEEKTRPREKKFVKISSEFLFKSWGLLGEDKVNSILNEISMCVGKWAVGKMSDREFGWRVCRIQHDLFVLLGLFKAEKEVKEVMDDQMKYDKECDERSLGPEDVPF